MTAPLMPKATAVWLVDNTALTFDQIALFCGLHPLEVKGIANGDVAQGIKGMDPINNGQITRAELERCQNDPTAHLQLAERKVDIPEAKPQKGARYTPLSKRQERPDAIAWLVRNHPELNDAEIGRLVGTTKPTIQSIRDRSHWNMGNITPVDPVTLGLCKQMELDEYVEKAARREERRRKKAGLDVAPAGEMLKPASETTAIETAIEPAVDPMAAFEESASPTADKPQPADAVFGTNATEPADTAEEALRPEDVFKS
ncbi:MAG: DUF1013 domain-containing protein [Alphaproteobacteria bacterium]|nr:DUF1013 domain-containing protein [Alphaproteobacteria bacterium]